MRGSDEMATKGSQEGKCVMWRRQHTVCPRAIAYMWGVLTRVVSKLLVGASPAFAARLGGQEAAPPFKF